MWIRNAERNDQEVLDWVEISGTLWVEVKDEKGVEDVHAGIERESDKNPLQAEACIEEIND